jgi:hypothetical protein
VKADRWDIVLALVTAFTYLCFLALSGLLIYNGVHWISAIIITVVGTLDLYVTLDRAGWV